MGKTVFQVISKEIEERIADLQTAMGNGAMKDYPAYREAVGKVQGLRATLNYVNELARAYQEQEDGN